MYHQPSSRCRVAESTYQFSHLLSTTEYNFTIIICIYFHIRNDQHFYWPGIVSYFWSKASSVKEFELKWLTHLPVGRRVSNLRTRLDHPAILASTCCAADGNLLSGNIYPPPAQSHFIYVFCLRHLWVLVYKCTSMWIISWCFWLTIEWDFVVFQLFVMTLSI